MDVVESDGYDGYQKDGENQHGRDPESWQAESHSKSPEVFAARNKITVYKKSHCKEECYTSEDNDVVKDCPICSIESNL